MSLQSSNIARFLPAMARQQPETCALKVPRGSTDDGRIDYLTLSYQELDAEVNAWVDLLRAKEVKPGDRVLLMVRQGLPLIAGAFALFKHGAVPVVIDPGMGLKSFLSCVRRSQPRVLLGIPLARAISHVFRGAFKSVRIRVPASGNALARLTAPGAPRMAVPEHKLQEPIFRASTDLAAVLFTSGSTGAPKGVCYEHGVFEAQVSLIRSTYSIKPGEVDLPMLPIFALFNPALGMTTVVPEMDPSRPAAVDPERIVKAIRQEGVTNSFGSPTLWRKIGEFCIRTGVTLPSLKRVLCAGAPVPAPLWEMSRKFLSNGKLHSPYGATEALPVSTISSEEIDPGSVRGACVGRAVEQVEVRVIRPVDGPIAEMSVAIACGVDEVGEIVVRGPVVTRQYDQLPDATACAKIPDTHGFWHRMGDCGFLDQSGRIWFCGRKVERVECEDGVLYTEPCEQVFRGHSAVERCALIGLGPRGKQQPALVVQRRRDHVQQRLCDSQLATELRALGRSHLHTAGITRFFFHRNFPVDVRHNAKIHRLTLAKWAAEREPVMVF